MVAGVLRWFNALRWLTSQSTSKLSVPALTKYSPTGSHCLAAEAQTKPICPSLSRQEMGSVRKVMLQAIEQQCQVSNLHNTNAQLTNGNKDHI